MSDAAVETLIRAARAIDAMKTAASYTEAADEGRGTPDCAGRFAWDASSLLRNVGETFIRLAEEQKFQAKRFERAAREEYLNGAQIPAVEPVTERVDESILTRLEKFAREARGGDAA